MAISRATRIVLPILLAFVLISMMPSGKLRKGFEALGVYNYFLAKDLFYNSLKKDSVPAAYGLSLIYGRDDNPFYNTDSAFKYVSVALDGYPDLEADDKLEYATLGVDSLNIQTWSNHIDLLFYKNIETKPSVLAWENFIQIHHSDSLKKEAELNRNELAFAEACAMNTSLAYADFLADYPEAIQVQEAKRKLDRTRYEEGTSSGLIADYRRFIADYPNSPYRSDAEFRVYEKYTKDGLASSYSSFIEENPENEFVNEAWKQIYALEIGTLTARNLAEFTIAYPDYPFMDELNDAFTYATTRYYPVEIDGKWGFIDEDGKTKIEAKYDWVEVFSENVAVVSLDDEVFFINKGGERLSNLIFDDAYTLKNGFSVVERDDKYGVVNRLGNITIPIEYEDMGEYSEGLFYAANDTYYGYFDDKGQVAIEFQFDDAGNFINGRAIVSVEGANGLIDKSGNQVSDFRYDWIEPFQEDRRPSRMRIGDKFGLIDQVGTVLCDTIYDRIGTFNEGLVLAASSDSYGFLNQHGDTVIDFKYTLNTEALERSNFYKGYAMVYQKDKVGIIDSTGAKVFPAIFEDIGLYEGDLIPIKKRGKWGYSDLEVNLAIPYQFDYAENFKDSLAIVSQKGKQKLIDKSGKDVLAREFSSLTWVDTLLIAKDSLSGIIDTRGVEVVPLVYSSINEVDEIVLKLELPDGRSHYFDRIRRTYIWKP